MSKKKGGAERPLPQSLALPCTGVDAHAHLDLPEFAECLDEVLERAAASGIAAIGQVFLSPEAYHAGQARLSAYPNIFFILGIHPCEAMRCTGEALNAMRAALQQDARLRAVGETGLDLYWKDCPLLIQEEAFRLHIALARETQRPLVIHSRDAAADTLRILEAEHVAGTPLLWHCFSGDAVEHVERILANGWHISVPGSVSYPANTALREAVAHIPADRLLVETDCPYLAPLPWRGKRNEPALAVFTAQAMACARGVETAELWTLCGDNARRFFGV